MPLATHDNYARVAAAARQSHALGRSTAEITARDVDLARLYSHAFRGHVIGAFHATRVALEACPPATAADPWRRQALEALAGLADQALDTIYPDFRAVISTFHRYDGGIRRVLAALDEGLGRSRDPAVEVVRDRFRGAMERVSTSNGIAPARDNVAPEQASFVVPSLGITIVPLVYGDRHCWDAAYLAGAAADVPRHLHREGVEIHLGYGKLHGHTVLGDRRAEVTEGYAMAIPPRTPHGFLNVSGHEHFLPFIYGSWRLGGWGVVPDVEPRPVETAGLDAVSPDDPSMNGLVRLDREIERAAASSAEARKPLITAGAADRPDSGGLVLSIARAAPAGLDYAPGPFRIVGVARGRGRVLIGPEECEVAAHDHVGVPAGMTASARQLGDEPLVLLDAVLTEAPQVDGRGKG